jgi:hypothetical protein
MESCKFIRKHSHLYSPIKNVSRNNRNLNKLKVPFSKLKLVSHSPHNMSIKMYNYIPNYIKNQETSSSFNKKLKSLLTTKCYYNLQEFFEDKFVDV